MSGELFVCYCQIVLVPRLLFWGGRRRCRRMLMRFCRRSFAGITSALCSMRFLLSWGVIECHAAKHSTRPAPARGYSGGSRYGSTPYPLDKGPLSGGGIACGGRCADIGFGAEGAGGTSGSLNVGAGAGMANGAGAAGRGMGGGIGGARRGAGCGTGGGAGGTYAAAGWALSVPKSVCIVRMNGAGAGCRGGIGSISVPGRFTGGAIRETGIGGSGMRTGAGGCAATGATGEGVNAGIAAGAGASGCGMDDGAWGAATFGGELNEMTGGGAAGCRAGAAYAGAAGGIGGADHIGTAGAAGGATGTCCGGGV